jgi:hypothetical protein
MQWDPGIRILYPQPIQHPEDILYKDYVVITLYTSQGTIFYSTEKRENDSPNPRWELMIMQKYENHRQNILDNMTELYELQQSMEEVMKQLRGAAINGAKTVIVVGTAYLAATLAIRCLPSLAFAIA